ncbi:hypothetical protein AAVH_19023 [Aphelenchoides avenae]|nr:hypothetical protein AAVH_19023 [Aphelenchus avenae]
MKKETVNGFIYFAILPSLQLVPFVIASFIGYLDRLEKQLAFEKCKGDDKSLYDVDYEDRGKIMERCGYDYFDQEENPVKTTFTEMHNVCQCIVVWKPFLEALTILFLLPGFRNALLKRLKDLRRRLCRAKGDVSARSKQIAFVTTSASGSNS